METFKKAASEFLGTMILVLIGCGSAMCVGCTTISGVLFVAIAFGLGLTLAAYTAGSVSGGHFNPAVSLAMLITGKIGISDFIFYLFSQFLGATAGAGLLALIFNLGSLKDSTGAYGSNGLSGVKDSYAAGLIVEVLLTCLFVLFVLFVAHSEKLDRIGGFICGVALTGVHLLGIILTGTSVNPARSFGPALVAVFSGNKDPIVTLWVFLVAPMAGAALAALIFLFLKGRKKTGEPVVDSEADAGE